MKMKIKLFFCIFIIGMGVFFTEFNSNNMKQITVNYEYKMSAATDSGFSDENFYKCVVDSYNSENSSNVSYDTVLADSQLSTIKSLICKDKGVSNTSGLEKLTNVTELNLTNNNLKILDLSANKELLYVNLYSNSLTSMDFSDNTKIKGIYIKDNKLSSINLSKNIALESLDLSNDPISNIDLSNNINLRAINLSSTKISSINLTNNINLDEALFNNCKFSAIDLSRNINLTKLNLNNNNLNSIDLSKNTLLKYVVLSSNNLTTLDVSNNTNLIELSASYNDMTDIKLPNTDTIELLKLQTNKLTSIDVSRYTNLKNLLLSSNKLSSIDLSNNVNLTQLYISTNNLTSIDLSKLTKLAHFNGVFNKYDYVNFPFPENIINLALEADLVKNYDFSKFTNLKSLRVTDYYVIPVYGTKFNVSDFSNYKSSNVAYNEHILYSDFSNRTNNYIDSSNVIDGTIGSYKRYTLCSTNIVGYHKSCGNDITATSFTLDGNVTIGNLNTSNNSIYYYEGYRELRYMTLTSDKYTINDSTNTIEVVTDSDEEIMNNLNTSWKDTTYQINGDKLTLVYNNIPFKEFTLIRLVNPKTGNLFIYIAFGLLVICGGLGIFLYKKYYKNK